MSHNAHPTAALVASFLPHGPVLLLVDAAADGVQGLPEEARDRVVVFELPAGDHGGRLEAREPWGLRVPYGLANGDNATAQVPWEAVFSLSGRTQGGQMTTKSRMDRMPACLGPDPHLAMRWLMRHLGLGDMPAQPNEWRVAIRPEMLLEDGPRAGFEPDPQLAIARCFAADPPAAALLIDTSDPELSLPAAWPRLDGGAAQILVTPQPPVRDLRVDGRGVAWSAPLRDETRELGLHDFFVPWSAIGAMQHPAHPLGWFWPARLPRGMRQPMADNPELAPHLLRLEGAPLAARPEPPAAAPPLLLLGPPNDLPKPEALQDCDARGGGIVLLDARQAGVRLSQGLRGAGLLAVPFGVMGLPTAISFDHGGIDAELPGFEGERAKVSAPWSAIFAIATNQGAMRVHCWPQDYPDEVTVALSVLRHMAENDGQITASMEGLPIALADGPPPGAGRGTTVGLGRDDSGQYVLQLRQPCGPAQADGQNPEMRVEFCLRMQPMH